MADVRNHEERVTDNLEQLLEIVPHRITVELRKQDGLDELIEIVMDLGRIPEARFPGRWAYLGDQPVRAEDLEHVVARVGAFSGDNRAGIERTLHRISAIRNRQGKIVGLTCRVGRAILGTIDIIRDLVESGRSILIMGRPGVGKCVVGDTWLFTEHGMKRIADFCPAEPADESFHDLDLRLATPNGTERTSQFYYDGVRPTVRITTTFGYDLEGTTNHPVLILDPAGDLKFKPLGLIEAGDRVAIQRGSGLFGASQAILGFDWRPKTNAHDEMRVPTRLTPDLARYLGYIVAEGTTTYRYYTAFTNEDAEVVADVEAILASEFGLPLRRQVAHEGWTGRDYRVLGRKHRDFLAHLGIDYVRAAEKRIPDCILAAPKPIVAEFLRAYCEGEASIARQTGVEVASASRTLMRQLHVLLLNFGIVSKLRTRVNARNGKAYYYLNIKGHNLEAFAEEIGFVSSRKRAALAAVTGVRRNPNKDVVPHLQEALAGLRAQIAMTQPASRGLVSADGRELRTLVQGYAAAHSMLSKYTRTGQDPSYEMLARILGECGALDRSPIRQKLAHLYEMGFFYDAVATVEAGEAPVYDFTVPVSHSFFGNGFVNHNTTKLREIARVEADDLNKRVIVIDTSNEIAGDGDIPHPAIGRSRRMQVTTPDAQEGVMIEAVENHMPEVIVIDEIGTEKEAYAARTIAERGVQLIGTAHGNSLENLLMNPTLSDLVGGIQSVTLSDEEARRRGTQKTILERKAPPTFDIAIELQDRDRLAIHQDVAEVVDQLLRGYVPQPEIRTLDEAGQVKVLRESAYEPEGRDTAGEADSAGKMRIFPYAVSRSQLERVIRTLRVPAIVTKNVADADVVLVLKSYARNGGAVFEQAQRKNIPVYVVKANTIPQIQKSMREVMHLDQAPGGGALTGPLTKPKDMELPDVLSEEEEEALQEAQAAIESVLSRSEPAELNPASPKIRRIQHMMVERYNLRSESYGEEPNRRIRIFPN